MVIAACDEPAPRDPQPQATASEVSSDPSACANAGSVLADRKTLLGDPVTVDVDGDGAGDEVELHFDRQAEVGCQAFLVVATPDEIVKPVWPMGEPSGLPQPSIFGFSDLDGDGGFEIVISEASGASTQFVAAYKVVGDGIVALAVPETDTGLFPFGGSVGHIDAVDCSDDGAIRVSQAVPGEGRSSGQPNYALTRRTYRIEGTELVEIDVERRQMPIDRLAAFEEFGSGPFASCPAP